MLTTILTALVIGTVAGLHIAVNVRMAKLDRESMLVAREAELVRSGFGLEESKNLARMGL